MTTQPLGERSAPRAASTRAANLPEHAIRAIWVLAQAHPGTIHLEVGEPGFPTPAHVVEAAADAGRQGHTRYTHNAGIRPLREAIADKVGRINGYSATPDQVVVTNGAVQALYATLATLTDPGDEVILPSPAWTNFVQMTHLLGTPSRFYVQGPRTDFMPDPDEIEALITPRTRVLLINSPSNPLGATVAPELWGALVALAERHGIWLLSDECYDQITFEDGVVSAMGVAPSPNVISIYSFSKVYAMTGWRVGYVVAPQEVAEPLSRLQEPLISCVNTPAQMAALAALTGPQDMVAEMVDAYRERRDRAVAVLQERGVPVVVPGGAFYLWVDISAGGVDSTTFAKELIVQRGVAVAPGAAFGEAGDGFVRVSLANDLDAVVTGVEAVADHIAAA